MIRCCTAIAFGAVAGIALLAVMFRLSENFDAGLVWF
jgi:hypothetical protein